MVESDCYGGISSDQQYVANPGCDGNCTLVSYCASPVTEVTCVSSPSTCELEIIIMHIVCIVMFETTACVHVECSVMIGI